MVRLTHGWWCMGWLMMVDEVRLTHDGDAVDHDGWQS